MSSNYSVSIIKENTQTGRDPIPSQSSVIDTHLAGEIVKSEKRRLEIFIYALLVATATGFIYSLIDPEAIRDTLIDLVHFYVLMAWGIVIALLLLLARKFIHRTMVDNGVLKPRYRYISVTIETLIIFIPSFWILISTNNASFLDSPIVFIFMLLIIVSALHLDMYLSLYTGVFIGVLYAAMLIYSINNCETEALSLPASSYFMRSIIFILAGLSAGAVSQEIKKRVVSSLKISSERDQVQSLLHQHVSKEVAEHLLTSEELTAKQPASIFFLDIRNFTTITRNFPPEKIAKFQNDFFTPILNIIEENKGVTNQILGDGIMASFGVPVRSTNHRNEAYQAAVSIDKFSREFKEKHPEYPVFNIGMGLHCGEIVLSNIGSDSRKQFTLSGLAVIISARLEQMTKQYEGAVLLASKDFSKRIDQQIYPPQSLGEHELRGVGKSIEVVQLI